MKTNRKHIILSWILLCCFIAGQWSVWSHQHISKVNFADNRHITHKTVISEHCRLCDAMHYNAMVVFSMAYFAPVTVCNYRYKVIKYAFTGITLILSAGRSPPMA